VSTIAIIPAFEVIEEGRTRLLARGPRGVRDNLPLQRGETFSATALSRQFPLRLMLAMAPCCVSYRW